MTDDKFTAWRVLFEHGRASVFHGHSLYVETSLPVGIDVHESEGRRWRRYRLHEVVAGDPADAAWRLHADLLELEPAEMRRDMMFRSSFGRRPPMAVSLALPGLALFAAFVVLRVLS
jgi:hypothetical protein